MGARLNFNQLKAFYHLAKSGSYAAAAAELSVTPRAVRLQIDSLERQWRTKFFRREGKHLLLTEAGRTLYPYAESIMEHAATAEQALADLAVAGNRILRIGTVRTIARRLMPGYILGFRRVHPGIQIKLAEGNSREMTMSVVHGVNDLAIVGRVPRPAELRSIPLPGLEADEIVLVVHISHPLARRSVVEVEDIAELPLILRSRGSATRTVVDNYFARLGFRPTSVLEADSFAFAKDLIRKGAGAALVSRLSIDEVSRQEGLTGIPFGDGGIWMKKDIVYLDEPSLNPAARQFLAFLVGDD